MLLLCALIAGSTSVWAQTVLFHETFGDNSGSARNWTNNYSVKSGIAAVYAETDYIVTKAKQCKNTGGSTKSALIGTNDQDACIIIGPLSVAAYSQLKLTYKWKAASVSATYSTSVAYKTDAGDDFTTIKTYGNTTGATPLGATGFVDADYTLPAEATCSTLYLKITFNTSNTQALIDEVELQYIGDAVPSTPSTEVTNIPVCTMSIATCAYSTKTWTNNDNSDYTLGDGETEIPVKEYSGINRIKLSYGKTYTVTVPSSIAVTKVAITGVSTNATSGTQITIDGVEKTIASLGTDVFFISTPTPGGSISIGVAGKEFGLESIVLYTADGKTLTTTDNMDGWRSFYESTTQNYEVDANTTIYTVASKTGESNKVELTAAAGKIIPGQTPVILKTTAGDHKIVLTKTETAVDLGSNLLAAATGSAIDGYRLGFGSIGVGFYKYAGTPAAGTVYIDSGDVTTSARELGIGFGDDITAINKVEAKKAENGVFYNLAGQKVAQPTKGLYIVNGKKVVLK